MGSERGRERLWFGAKGLSLPLLPFAEGVLLARMLQPQDFRAAQALFLLVAFFEIPCRWAPMSAMGYYVSMRARFDDLRGSVLRLLFPIAGLTGLALLLCSDRLASVLGDPRLGVPFAAASVLPLFIALERVWGDRLRGPEGRLLRIRAELGASAVRVVCLTALLSLGGGPASVLGACLAFSLSAVLLAKDHLARFTPPEQRRPEPAPPASRLVSFMGAAAASNAAGVVLRRGSLLWAMAMLPHVEAGLFAGALSLSRLVLFSEMAVGPYSMFLLQDHVRSAGGAALPAALRRALWTVGLPAFGAALGVVLLGAPLIRLLFGEAYAGSFQAVRLLAAGSFFLALHGFFVAVLTRFGRPGVAGALQWGVAALQAALLLLLIPRRGAEGAAAACLLSWGAACAASAAALFLTRWEGRLLPRPLGS